MALLLFVGLLINSANWPTLVDMLLVTHVYQSLTHFLAFVWEENLSTIE